jgi:hypothetical protein
MANFYDTALIKKALELSLPGYWLALFQSNFLVTVFLYNYCWFVFARFEPEMLVETIQVYDKFLAMEVHAANANERKTPIGAFEAACSSPSLSVCRMHHAAVSTHAPNYTIHDSRTSPHVNAQGSLKNIWSAVLFSPDRIEFQISFIFFN